MDGPGRTVKLYFSVPVDLYTVFLAPVELYTALLKQNPNQNPGQNPGQNPSPFKAQINEMAR